MKRYFSPFAAGLLLLAASPAHAQAGPSLTLHVATLKSGLVKTTTLPLATEHPGVTAYGVVIDPSPIIALRGRIITAQASLTLAAASLTRTRNLYRSSGNVSEASLQKAEARASVARARLATLQAEAKSGFGPALGAAITTGGAMLHAIEAARSLVSVVQAGVQLPTPSRAEARTLDGSLVTLRPIGPAGRIPQGLLGQAFFYVGPTLAIDSPLAVTLETGKAITGYDVPTDALVWHADEAFAFVLTGPHRFTMYAIPTTNPSRHAGKVAGYFVPKADLPGTPAIVTSGAGLLNSILTGTADAAHYD